MDNMTGGFVSNIGKTGFFVANCDKKQKNEEEYEWCNELKKLENGYDKKSHMERLNEKMLKNRLKKEKNDLVEDLENFEKWYEKMSYTMDKKEFEELKEIKKKIKKDSKKIKK